MRKIWPFSFNFLFFAAVAFVMPFLVLYYQNLGFSGTQIGILVGLTPLITLISSPLLTGLADATHHHRLLMSLALLLGAAAVCILPFANTFFPVIALVVSYTIFFSPVSAFSDSATMHMIGEQKELYGRVRAGGTVGFGLAALFSGSVAQNYGLKVAFGVGGLIYLLAMLISQKLVYNPAASASAPKMGALSLLKERRWFFFLCLALAGGLSISATNSYLFSFMKSMGASEGTMGLAMTMGTISEAPTFIFGSWLLKRFKSRHLLNLALWVTGFRLLWLSFSTTPNMVLFTQLLSGASFAVMWMAGVSYADENAPKGLNASAQGLFGAAVFGFGTAIGGFAGGPLLENFGGHGLYLVCGLAVLGTVLVVSLVDGRFSRELRKTQSEL
jgi:MFS transporter, PPP family, 3-phenylpropionic acid transporter